MTSETSKEDSQIKISAKLVDDLHTFTALVNNYLLSIPVQGDSIFESADHMKEAMRLFNELKKVKK